jgi:competence protein ComEC
MAAGVVCDRFWPLAAEVWFLASVAALAAWWIVWRQGRDSVASCVLLVSVLAAGGAWHHDRWYLFADDEVGRMVEEQIHPIAIEGRAMNSPRWVPAPPATALRTIPKGDETELTLWITAVRDGTTWRRASGWAALDCDGHLTTVRAGDRLRIMALGSRPMLPLNPGEFDFAAYERSRRTWCRLRGLFPESVTVVERGSDWSPRLWLSRVRQEGTGLLRRAIPTSRSTLAAAILLGAREQLDPERNEGFLVTGTIHVLSISGLHVGILAWGFWVVLRSGILPQRPAIVAAMTLTVAYAFLTDLQPPVVRATVLVVVLCLAKLAGRRAFGFNPLALAGIVVLVLQPSSLFLAGPQLSFLAVAVMILFAPLILPQPIVDPLDRLIAATRPWPVQWMRRLGGSIWRVWLTGALIWLVSLPIVWQQYNLLSPVALVVNTVIWIPITVALYGGFATLVLGFLSPTLGLVCGRMCDSCLWLMEMAIAYGREVPLAYAWLPAPPGWWVGLFYAVLAAMAAFPGVRPSRAWWFVLPVVWFAVAIGLATPPAKERFAAWPRRADVAAMHRGADGSARNATEGVPYSAIGTGVSAESKLSCTFVAVGHGIACLIELPDGRAILYDAGKLGSPLGAVRPVSSVLWSRGIQHLDAVLISHADSDHFNALPELLDRFSIGTIYVSPLMFETPQPAVEELRSAIERSGVPLRFIQAGDRLASTPGVLLEVLHPPRKGVFGSDNANSLVLRLEFAGRRILLTGDLEPPGLEDVLAEEPLDCDAVLAPHHGSRRSDPTGFALWSTPEHVVISGARNAEDEADIESVKDSYRARGAQVYHTAEAGCVRIELSASGVRVATFRPTR